MKRKARILIIAAKKTLGKVSRIRIGIRGGEDFYQGKSIGWVISNGISYPFRYGPRATVSKLKKELRRISSGGGNLHQFPNGVVSGVDVDLIKGWSSRRPVSIVIPSYNDFAFLKPCVESVHETCGDVDYEIIIVDDYCEEENRKQLRTLADDRTRIIFREKNGGFAKAVNTGMREVPSTHDAVLLNSDIVARRGWLKSLQYAAYEFSDNVGIVGPKLLYPDGRIQSAGSYRNTEDTEWFDHYYRFQQEDYGPANVPHYCLATTGACMYITRELIDEIGILDDDFQFAFEDADYCLRAWEAGYKTLYFPAATLVHYESVSRAKNKTISEKEKQAVTYFWKKWGDWFDKRNVKDKNGKIRIIFVLQTLGWSGGIKIVVEHANRLAEKGFAPEIWSLDDKPVWDIRVPTRHFKNYKKLTSALASEEAIKVATWWETASPVWLASVKKGIAVNFIQEIESWFYPGDPDAQRTVISCYRKEFKNLTTSSYNLDEINQLGLKAVLIPCGYDDTVYYKKEEIKKQDNVLLALGRSFFQKNFMYSFEAWLSLGNKRPNFWLFGSEPDMKTLDEKITYYYKPSDEEVNDLYNTSTAFIQTSYHEGFCLPLLEAMATGTPVICTDAHGNRDFCINEKTALYVEQNNKKQLTQTIDRLFSDKKLRDKLSRNAIKEAKKYAWPAITDRLVDYYSDIATHKPITEKVIKKYGK